MTVQATHRYVHDPDMARTLDVWVKLLAEAVRNKKPVSEPPSSYLASEPGEQARPTR